MKKTLSAFIIIFSFSCVFAQKEDIRKYYKYANKAELSICDGKYAKASRFYDKAFKHKTYPFDRDLINALLCEIYSDLNNNEKILDYTYKLAIKSFNVKERIKDLEQIVDSALYKNIIIITDTTPSKLNVDLLQAFDILDSLDQTPRRKCRTYQPECIGDILINDSLNLLTIDSLYNVYGSINEENIGSIEMDNTFFLILMHNFQWLKHPFQEKLLSEVIEGKIDARLFAQLEDMYLTYKNTENRVYKYGTDLHFMINETLFFNNHNNKQINKNRKSIYLESINILVKKCIFSYIYDKKGFHIVDRRYYDFGSDNDGKAKFIERMKMEYIIIKEDDTYIK